MRALLSVCVLGLLSHSLLAQATATQPVSAATVKAVESARVYGDYAKLSNLTAEQKVKISEIQSKIRQQIKQLEEQEENEVLALLTEAQLAELAANRDEVKTERSSKARERYQKMKDALDKVNAMEAAAKATPTPASSPQ